MQDGPPSRLLDMPSQRAWWRPFVGRWHSSLIGSHEVSGLWHCPPSEGVYRVFSRALPQLGPDDVSGALIGNLTAGLAQPAYFDDYVMGLHHFYVARTRMGKTTLMLHVARHKMVAKGQGRDDGALVIVDPHSDLVPQLLPHVPHALRERIWLIDLSNDARFPGINVLDTSIFADRDHTSDGVIRVIRALSRQGEVWGSRMQNVFEHTIRTLHEANSHSSDPDSQYTLLHASTLLNDVDFRDQVLGNTQDPFLRRWWDVDFAGWTRTQLGETIQPVQTRLARFRSAVKARRILGQSRSTIDLAGAIRNGDIILVNTAQSNAGREIASMVGSAVLNLVDSIVRRQGNLPPAQRRRVTVMVDEMQTIPGVDYGSMLSEVAKYGGNLVTATQSMSNLNHIDSGLRHTLMANVGCLCVFQCGAEDTAYLAPELGIDFVKPSDISGLPRHRFYVRAGSMEGRPPPYAVELNPPPPGDPKMLGLIATDSARYTLTAEEADRIVNRSA